MSKHTPGPWMIDAGHSIKGDNGMQVAYADLMSKEDEALMLSAPNLLEALEMASQSAGFQYMTHETRDAIESALSKARGES